MKNLFHAVFLMLSFELLSLDLYELDPDENYLESGASLMELDVGLHNLEEGSSGKTILVGVHGGDSRGFEWIYPLQTLDNQDVQTYFFRWDTTKCPSEGAEILSSELKALLSPTKKPIVLVGHSLGGVLVSQLVDSWNLQNISIHAVAAPLNAEEFFKYCEYSVPTKVSAQVSFTQWRTQKDLDNAFNSYPYDPQVIPIFAGMQVIDLPRTYRGRRLGHLWALSWTADYIKGNQEENDF